MKKEQYCQGCWRELPEKSSRCPHCQLEFDSSDPATYYGIRLKWYNLVEFHTFWLLVLLTPGLILSQIPLSYRLAALLFCGHLLLPGGVRAGSREQKKRLYFWLVNEIMIFLFAVTVIIFNS